MTSWLHEQRLAAARDVVLSSGAATILDLGCGDGDLMVRLADEPHITRIVGVDICEAALDRLRKRLDALGERPARKVDLVRGSMSDPDPSWAGLDCAVLIETIEHLPPEHLSALELSVFVEARPRTVVITTPNVEFNPLLGVPAHRFRHRDHRFEWSRRKFRHWAEGVAARRRYRVACSDIAGRHPEFGGASQMAVFRSMAGLPEPALASRAADRSEPI